MSLQQKTAEFVSSVGAGDYDKAVGLLPSIKIEFAKAGLLSTTPTASKEDLLVARQILEMGVLALIHAHASAEEITRLIAQVRPYYTPEFGLPPSEDENKIVALYLLLLLTSNEISEFHMELVTLHNADTDTCLRYPVLLERWLMEGAYDKAWQAVTDKKAVPAPEFAILAKQLQAAIRLEIALCMETAYVSLPLANARHLLFLENDAQLLELAEQQHWKVANGAIVFPNANAPENHETSDEQVLSNLLEYTTQIESII